MLEDVLAREIKDIVERTRARLSALERDPAASKAEVKSTRALVAKLDAWHGLMTADRGYQKDQLPHSLFKAMGPA